jgi:hypothetical protein
MRAWTAIPAALAPPLLAAVALLRAEPATTPTDAARHEQTSADAHKERVDKVDPDVVFIGNSVTAAALEPRRLDEALGELRPLVLTAPGSLAPTWFLIATHEVFEVGARPKVLALVNPPVNLLSVRPGSQLELQQMVERMVGEEPELTRIMGYAGEPWATLWQLRLRGAMVRDATLDVVRGLGVQAVVWPQDGWLTRARQKRKSNNDFEEVFPPNAAAPMVQADFRLGTDIAAPEESFLPALLALTRRHDASLLLVETPTLDPAGALPPDADRALAAWCAANDVPLVDLREGYAADHFRDGWHLNDGGSRRFTRALAPVIRRALAGNAPVVDLAPNPPQHTEIERWPDPLALPTWEVAGPCAWRAPISLLRGAPDALLAHLDVELTVDGDALPRGEAAGCDGTWRLEDGGVRLARRATPAQAALAWTRPAPESTWGETITLWLPPGAALSWRVPRDADVSQVVADVRGRAFGDAIGSGVTVGVGRDAVPVTWSDDRTRFRRVRKATVPASPTWVLRVNVAEDGPLVFFNRVAGRSASASDPVEE